MKGSKERYDRMRNDTKRDEVAVVVLRRKVLDERG